MKVPRKKKNILVIILAVAMISASLAFMCYAWSMSKRTEVPAPAPSPTSVPDTEATPPPTPEPIAVPITKTEPEKTAVEIDVAMQKGGWNASYVLRDGSIYSTAILYPGDELVIESTEGVPIATLYLCWTLRPDDYEIVLSDGTVQTVEGGMLHQSVHLEKPCNSVILRTGALSASLQVSDIRVFSEGTLPREIQDWIRMPEGTADICLFPAHADDEYVFFGSILPYYAGELGKRVQVCWMTCHDNDPIRNHELLNALWKSGCVYYPEIQYTAPDIKIGNSLETAMVYYSFDDWEKYQIEMIRKYRPLVCVGHAESGEYGHGAHILAAFTLERAVAESDNPAVFPESAEKYGTWDPPKTYIHLYGADPTYLDFSLPLQFFNGKTVREAALDCYQEHQSQVSSSTFTVYDRGTPYDASCFGLYRSTVGDDIRHDDLMENLEEQQKRI